MIEEKLSNCSLEIQNMFFQLKEIVYAAFPEAQEKLWAGLPSYYAGKAFVRIIPFKDHLNIEAASLFEYRNQLQEIYKFTPKNIMQIFVGQPIPTNILFLVFQKTLAQEF